LEKLDVLGFLSMCSAKIYSVEPDSAKSDGPVLETGGSQISRNSDNSSKATTTNHDDWMEDIPGTLFREF
jgi:hypothetical protein